MGPGGPGSGCVGVPSRGTSGQLHSCASSTSMSLSDAGSCSPAQSDQQEWTCSMLVESMHRAAAHLGRRLRAFMRLTALPQDSMHMLRGHCHACTLSKQHPVQGQAGALQQQGLSSARADLAEGCTSGYWAHANQGTGRTAGAWGRLASLGSAMSDSVAVHRMLAARRTCER